MATAQNGDATPTMWGSSRWFVYERFVEYAMREWQTDLAGAKMEWDAMVSDRRVPSRQNANGETQVYVFTGWEADIQS